MPKGQPSPDLTSQVFGLWTVIERDYDAMQPGVCYICECTCGLRKTLRGSDLATGRSTGCRSCHSRRIGTGTVRRKDLTGDQIGDWLVLAFSHTENGRAYWKCLCCCGVTKPVNGVSLRTGGSRRCASCAQARRHAGTDN
jgi:hypothetical protein